MTAIFASLFARHLSAAPFRSMRIAQAVNCTLARSPTRVKHSGRSLLQQLAFSNAPTSRSVEGATSRGVFRSLLSKSAGIILVGTAISTLSTNGAVVHCDSPTAGPVRDPPHHAELPPPPSSSVNLRELTFGSVCGLCAGVFIKKGLKTVAFVLGGIFVLLQYFGSLSFLKMDWQKVGTRFENTFYSETNGTKRPPSVVSLWNWIIAFLTSDFQPRAAFISGFVLGLRVG